MVWDGSSGHPSRFPSACHRLPRFSTMPPNRPLRPHACLGPGHLGLPKHLSAAGGNMIPRATDLSAIQFRSLGGRVWKSCVPKAEEPQISPVSQGATWSQEAQGCQGIQRSQRLLKTIEAKEGDGMPGREINLRKPKKSSQGSPRRI